MTTSPITDALEAYQQQPASERDALHAARQLWSVIAEDKDMHALSSIGTAARFAWDLKLPEIIVAMAEAIPAEEKSYRAAFLSAACHHIHHHHPTADMLEKLFSGFSDTLNTPDPYTGRTVIFHGIRAEESKAFGVLEAMVRHGARGDCEMLRAPGNNGMRLQSALAMARMNIMPDSGHSRLDALHAGNNLKWQRIIDMLEGKTPQPLPVSERTR